MQTIAYALVGNCFVLAVGDKEPSEAEWTQYLAYVRSHLTSATPVTLVSSRGGGPTSAQRSALNALTKELGVENTLKVAVLTQSNVVRGIATALGWFVKGYRAFAPADIGAALDFLGVKGAVATQIKAQVPKLHEQMA